MTGTTDWSGTALERAIWDVLRPGYGLWKDTIQCALEPGYSRTAISRCMTDMRRRGLLVYSEGRGFWSRHPHRDLEVAT